MAEEIEVMYSTPHSPGISIKLGGRTWKAKNSVLTLPASVARELDQLSMVRGDVSSNFVKLADRGAAEALARAHMAANSRPQAQSGGMTSSNAKVELAAVPEHFEILTPPQHNGPASTVVTSEPLVAMSLRDRLQPKATPMP